MLHQTNTTGRPEADGENTMSFNIGGALFGGLQAFAKTHNPLAALGAATFGGLGLAAGLLGSGAGHGAADGIGSLFGNPGGSDPLRKAAAAVPHTDKFDGLIA